MFGLLGDIIDVFDGPPSSNSRPYSHHHGGSGPGLGTMLLVGAGVAAGAMLFGDMHLSNGSNGEKSSDHRVRQWPSPAGIRPIQPFPVTRPYSQGRVKGLFIGINYKGTSGELSGCVNDVQTMLNMLQRIEYPLQEAVILVDDPRFPGRTGEPTKHGILQGLRWLCEGARPGDCLFLHFSGHGSQLRNTDGTEEDGMDECMVPLDYQRNGMIIDDDIYLGCVQPLPPGVRLTAVMDCCHSGTLMDLPYEFQATSQAAFGQPMMRCVSRKGMNLGCDVLMLSGCADNQTSADVGNSGSLGGMEGRAGGACTNALANVMVSTRGLSMADLLRQMRDFLKSKRYSQVPQLCTSKPMDLRKPFSMFGALDTTQQFHQYASPAPQLHHVHGYPQYPQGAYQPGGQPYQGGYPQPQQSAGYNPFAAVQPQGYPQPPPTTYYPQQQNYPPSPYNY